MVSALCEDYQKAELNPADRAMLDYVAKLTLAPATMLESDVLRLRANDFDDVAILQINLIASWFNYINRVADGLGVGYAQREKLKVMPPP